MDGQGDNSDADDDGDGVNDGIDAFPTDASEWDDTDGDGQVLPEHEHAHDGLHLSIDGGQESQRGEHACTVVLILLRAAVRAPGACWPEMVEHHSGCERRHQAPGGRVTSLSLIHI